MVLSRDPRVCYQGQADTRSSERYDTPPPCFSVPPPGFVSHHSPTTSNVSVSSYDSSVHPSMDNWIGSMFDKLFQKIDVLEQKVDYLTQKSDFHHGHAFDFHSRNLTSVFTQMQGIDHKLNEQGALLSDINSRFGELQIQSKEFLPNSTVNYESNQKHISNENKANVREQSCFSTRNMMSTVPDKNTMALVKENARFSNSEFEIAPVFLENLESTVKEVSRSVDFKNWIGCCFDGEAKEWWDIMKFECDDYNNFKCRFLNRFWGKARRKQLLNKLQNGYYSKAVGSKEKYFGYLFALGRHLDAYEDDFSLITDISKHYNERIMDAVISRKIDDPDSFINLLIEYDMPRCNYALSNASKNDQFYRNPGLNKNANDNHYQPNRAGGPSKSIRQIQVASNNLQYDVGDNFNDYEEPKNGVVGSSESHY